MGQLINQLDLKAYVNDKTNNSQLIVHALTTYNIFFKDSDLCWVTATVPNCYYIVWRSWDRQSQHQLPTEILFALWINT